MNKREFDIFVIKMRGDLIKGGKMVCLVKIRGNEGEG